MFDILLIVEKYGLYVGTLILMLFLLWAITRWINRLDTKIREHSIILEKLNEDLGDVHSGCSIPQGAIKSLQEDIVALQLKDKEIDGDIKTLVASSNQTNEYMKEMKESLTLIVNTFVLKGMDTKEK